MGKSFFTPPYVGVFLEGFLTNFDWRSIVVNAVQMILSIALWYPFFKAYEQRFIEKEQENSSSILSEEDEALLEEMDLGI